MAMGLIKAIKAPNVEMIRFFLRQSLKIDDSDAVETNSLAMLLKKVFENKKIFTYVVATGIKPLFNFFIEVSRNSTIASLLNINVDEFLMSRLMVVDHTTGLDAFSNLLMFWKMSPEKIINNWGIDIPQHILDYQEQIIEDQRKDWGRLLISPSMRVRVLSTE